MTQHNAPAPSQPKPLFTTRQIGMGFFVGRIGASPADFEFVSYVYRVARNEAARRNAAEAAADVAEAAAQPQTAADVAEPTEAAPAATQPQTAAADVARYVTARVYQAGNLRSANSLYDSEYNGRFSYVLAVNGRDYAAGAAYATRAEAEAAAEAARVKYAARVAADPAFYGISAAERA